MKIEILTIFPGYFESLISEGIFRIALDKGLVSVRITDIRDFTEDVHRSVDDYPFGGGAGMVMKPEPLYKALDSVLGNNKATKGTRVIIPTPRGRRFDQAMAQELSGEATLVFLCGHYEGIDERVYAKATDELSIGDYVLSGGEPATVVMLDGVVRLIAGVLGSGESLVEESFANGLLEYPHYTRPREFMNIEVPDVLLSGNHGKISRWRRDQAITMTVRWRPDLIARADLTEKEKQLAERLLNEKEKGRLKQ